MAKFRERRRKVKEHRKNKRRKTKNRGSHRWSPTFAPPCNTELLIYDPSFISHRALSRALLPEPERSGTGGGRVGGVGRGEENGKSRGGAELFPQNCSSYTSCGGHHLSFQPPPTPSVPGGNIAAQRAFYIRNFESFPRVTLPRDSLLRRRRTRHLLVGQTAPETFSGREKEKNENFVNALSTFFARPSLILRLQAIPPHSPEDGRLEVSYSGKKSAVRLFQPRMTIVIVEVYSDIQRQEVGGDGGDVEGTSPNSKFNATTIDSESDKGGVG